MHEVHAANFKTLKPDCLSLEPALPNPTAWRPGASYFISLRLFPPLKMYSHSAFPQRACVRSLKGNIWIVPETTIIIVKFGKERDKE